MTESPRTVPTPGDLAAARRPASPPPVTGYDRHRWEQDLLTTRLHFSARLVGLTLAHYALDGYLPEDGVQHSGRMADRTGLSPQRVRQCLRDLERDGFISRPPSADWQPKDRPRPITLTLPGTARLEPPSTGAVPE